MDPNMRIRRAIGTGLTVLAIITAAGGADGPPAPKADPIFERFDLPDAWEAVVALLTTIPM